MDDLTMLTQEEADLLMDLLWVAKSEAESNGEQENAEMYARIAEKIDEQAIAYGYADA